MVFLAVVLTPLQARFAAQELRGRHVPPYDHERARRLAELVDLLENPTLHQIEVES